MEHQQSLRMRREATSSTGDWEPLGAEWLPRARRTEQPSWRGSWPVVGQTARALPSTPGRQAGQRSARPSCPHALRPWLLRFLGTSSRRLTPLYTSRAWLSSCGANASPKCPAVGEPGSCLSLASQGLAHWRERREEKGQLCALSLCPGRGSYDPTH